MYDINTNNVEEGMLFYSIFLGIGMLFCIIGLVLLIFGETLFALFFIIIPAIPAATGAIGISNIKKRVKKIEMLNHNGKLYKNIPYTLVPSGISVNYVEIMKPEAKFKLPSGVVLTLYGDPRYDRVPGDDDGYIDLVIDPTDYSNYFLDYSINRLSGNRPEDFYKSIEELEREKKNRNIPYEYEYPNEFTFSNHDNSNDGSSYKSL